jgi:hypothetical protein
MRAFSGINNDQAFWMFDQPAADGKARSPIGVDQDIGYPRKPGFVAGLAMAALDLYFACLNVVQLHGAPQCKDFALSPSPIVRSAILNWPSPR